MEKKLVKALMDKHEVRTTKGKSLEIDGIAVLPRGMDKFLTPDFARLALDEKEMLAFYESKEEVGEIIFNMVKLEIKNRKLSESGLSAEQENFTQKNSFKYRKLFPILDVRTNQKGIYDLRENQISDLSYDAWEETVCVDKDVYQALMSRRMLGLLEYDPYTYEKAKVVKYKEQDIYQFNSHIFPEWRFDEVKTPSPPQFFFSFMEHLFPNTEARQFAYYWMRNAIFNRNQTVLLLSSNMGTGKGTLTDILEQLVGESNFQKQGEGFFQTRFNAELENKRVVLFDEVSVQKRTKEQLKLFCNNTIPIEKKGVDVRVAIPNYGSYIVANNYPYENKLLADDRRFSVPEITDTPLLEVFSEDEVNTFHRDLKYDPEVAKQIGWWIKANGELEGWDVNIPYKKERYHYLVRESMSEWQKFTLEVLESGKDFRYLMTDIKEDFEDTTGFRGRFPAHTKMDNFLTQFKDKQGNTVGSCVKDNNEWYLVPTTLDI